MRFTWVILANSDWTVCLAQQESGLIGVKGELERKLDWEKRRKKKTEKIRKRRRRREAHNKLLRVKRECYAMYDLFLVNKIYVLS